VTIDVFVPDASLISVLASFVWLVLTGRLVPASQLDAVRKDRDKAVARADAETRRWQSAYEFSEESRRIDAGHVEKLIEVGRATNQIFTALPGAASEAAGDPDAHMAS